MTEQPRPAGIDLAGDRESIVHDAPTVATVKALYAVAFRCAFPTCQRPLYRMSDTTGALLLNSTVAHIHARREKGPRWNPDMSEAENRSAANLILLCLEHSKEIDVVPHEYPAEVLRQWKANQFADYQQVQRSWVLTDEQVHEVAERAFTPHDFGRESASAETVVQSTRLASSLIDNVRRTRRPIAQVLAEHYARGEWYTMRSGMYDEQGEPVRVRPPQIEIDVFDERRRAAITESFAVIEPLAGQLAAELKAVQAAGPHLASWCEWALRTVAAIVQEASRSRTEGDAALEELLAELSRATEAIGAAWRGEKADPPPALREPTTPTPETPTEAAGRRHHAVIVEAQPWGRVNTRPYNRALYDALIDQLPYAFTIPPVVTQAPYGLKRTAELAACVARNASVDEFTDRIVEAEDLAPLGSAVALLLRLSHVAEESGRDELADNARQRAEVLAGAADWRDPQTWEAIAMHGLALLATTARIVGDEELSRSLESALPTVGPALVLPALASWGERFQRFNFEGPSTPYRHIVDLPQWLPREVLVDLIRVVWPNLDPDVDVDEADDLQGDDVAHLAAQFLARHRAAAG